VKRDALKVGSKIAARTINGQTVKSFDCQFNRPENVADCISLAKGNETIVTALFVRGYTIWLQDRIGRPMFEEGESHEAIQKALDAAELGVTKGRGRPAKAKVVELPKNKASFTPEELAVILAKANIQIAK